MAQLLGIRGGDQASNIWKIRLQLCKPVTWVPLIWGAPSLHCQVQPWFSLAHTAPRVGVLCGAAASGSFTWTPENVAKSATCMLMSGPLLTGYTQTINDYFDRDIDAINEPNRPIPSGERTSPGDSSAGESHLM